MRTRAGVILAVVVAASFFTGCTPYVGYTHLSQPNVANDGYDLMCGGVEYQKRHVRLDVAACENLAPNHGQYAKVDVKFLIY